MAPSLRALLDRSRQELLDLSTRNRLLSLPVHSKLARLVHILDERSDPVFRLLVSEKRSLSFLPGASSTSSRVGEATQTEPASEPDLEEVGLPQPDEEADPATGLPKRHLDARLQTALSSEALQRRLLDLHRDAQTLLEEQGVHILYLALGHLKWFEAESADTPRYAPLILVPVELRRQSVIERFHLRWREEDFEENLSLRAKLQADFHLELPAFPEEDEFRPSAYAAAVAQAVAGRPGWEVLPDAMTLGFFSFAKFLMYRDLDPDTWPDPDALLGPGLIGGLLERGFPPTAPLISDEAPLDALIPAARLDHVVDADSSQTLAIEAVRQGRNLVIQGPPGTGKSQSITNLIATAVLEGKRVLFVAEKLAALEVVKRRLEKEGLGPLCLELHSHKANKRAVLEELGRTWKLGRPQAGDLEAVVPKLEACRSRLNQHAASLHAPQAPSGLTPYALIGQLAWLGDRGHEAAGLTLTGAEAWTPADHAERRQLVEELVARLEHLGPPAQHPWRGVGRESILPLDLEPLEGRIRSLQHRLQQLGDTSRALAAQGVPPPATTLAGIAQQRLLAGFILDAPPADQPALAADAWDTGFDQLRALVAEGVAWTNAVRTAGAQVTPAAWDDDWSEARARLAASGRSWWRWLNADYRRAFAQISAGCLGEPPKAQADRLALTDCVLAGQRARRALREGGALGQSAFGRLWQGELSNWPQLEALVRWVLRQREAGLDAPVRSLCVRIENPSQLAPWLEPLTTQLEAARTEAGQLFHELRLDCRVAFGVAELDQVPSESLAERCARWLSPIEDLSRWIQYSVRARRARELGLAGILEALESGVLPKPAALDGFDRTYLGRVLREVWRQRPELAQFDGLLHDQQVEAFRQLDQERLALAKYRTLLAHFEHMPPPHAGLGATGLVKAELERKRGHRPVRRLLKDAGSVVQALKPVFMMSPLSVAQFLAPGAVTFDLLVIDEASQVRPVDALGAIARCRQLVVVGDSLQLPPTQFFTRLTAESPAPDEDEETVPATVEAPEFESILKLCCARGLPQSMLRWHYRSRHHSLIAVSNREFYQDRLFIVPSPHAVSAELGVRFHPVPDGVFDAGQSKTNRLEAKAVCQAILTHARRCPDLSLGVAAFSLPQQEAIWDELELLRRENPATESFFSAHPTEPFFVKNLENVQGDEREVIFISIGYGKDERGRLAMRFGPLNHDGGERRLNVLISRARTRCEVFTSLTAADIALERAPGRGVSALKAFLAFAQTGQLASLEPTAGPAASPFESTVRRALESLGYDAQLQVGVAGCFLDLAVRDPDRPGHFLLGVECDGQSYHAARSARDRDRLRPLVLADHGWRLHRVWSADWFQHPADQLQRVAQTLEKARTASAQTLPRANPNPPPVVPARPIAAVPREGARELDDLRLSQLTQPYRIADFPVPQDREPHALPPKELSAVLLRIIQAEGPIHEDELAIRVRDLWGLGRTGPRVQDAVARGVRSLIITRQCAREAGFLSIPGTAVTLRSREAVSAANLRKPEFLPPAEIRAAILAVLDLHHGAALPELPAATARLFGFKTTSPPLRALVEEQARRLWQQGIVKEVNGLLHRASSRAS